MNIRKIIKTLFHPTTIKIVGMICIVWFFFILPTFAQGLSATTEDTTMKAIQEGLSTFISICSRLRIIFAILAGKLMTNDFVYGAFLHMDIYLWKIRNIMKNFANFALIALVLQAIIKGLIGKEAIDVKKIITNTLLAGILIQASRFLMWAVIDISTVATAGISTFPIAFLNNDAGLQDEIKTSITKFKSDRIVVNYNATGNNIVKTIPSPDTNPQSSEDLRQNILPSYNSVSWPFIYLGMWVFHFQNYLSTESATGVEALTLWFALRFFFLLFFTIGLLLLFVANIMRIGLLRIFIIGAPFLILMQVFKMKEWSSGILKIFSISNLIAIVFKPVIFVIGISLMLIVIVSVQHGMLSSWSGRENNLNWVKLSQTSGTISTLAVEWVSNISVDQTDILGKDTITTGQNFFSHVLMLLLTLFIMRRFVKLSLTIGWWPIEETMKKLIKTTEGMAKSLPVVPLGGGTSISALWSAAASQKQKLGEGLGMDIGWSTGWTFSRAEDKFNQFVSSKMGIKQSWSNENYATIGRLAKNSPDFMDTSITIAKGTNEWLYLGDSRRRWYLEQRFNSPAGQNALASNGAQRNKTFDATFKDWADAPKNRKALHALMWWDAGLASGKKIDTWDISYNELMGNVYHKSSNE